MSIDINASNFISEFDPKKGNVGVIGHGYVGQAVAAFFEKTFTTRIYDKFKPQLGNLKDLVTFSEVIFVAVPSPMNTDGTCHTSIVESVLFDIQVAADEVGRASDAFVVVLKSTVPPGFTERMQRKWPTLRIVFSPEFLTEANSVLDFENQNRVVLGGDEDDARVVFKYFEAVAPQRVLEDRLVILQCSSTTAELVKLFTNGILMTKVLFSNEIYQVCQRMGVDYEEVRVLSCLDKRIGSSHTLVPGPDGKLGAGGSCFPKDINNLASLCRSLDIPERMFTAVIKRNSELRPEEDWKELKGRAVVDG